MPYSSSSNKAMASMKKQYGANWAHVYYGLANKRTGGFRGKNRGSRAANISYARGSHWSGKNKGGSTRRSRRRIRG